MTHEYKFESVPCRRWYFGRGRRREPQIFDTLAFKRIMALAGRAMKSGGYVEIDFETVEPAPPPKSRLRARPVYERFSGRIVFAVSA